MFKLVVVILCFATLLVSTGSALKKDEYEISIRHGSFAVHQRHSNAIGEGEKDGTSRSAPPLAPTVASAAPKRTDGLLFQGGSGDGGDGAGGGRTEGERISTTLAIPRPTTYQQSSATGVKATSEVKSPGNGDRRVVNSPALKSADFGAVRPGLEEVPLQANIFQAHPSPSSSYQSLEQDFRRPDQSPELKAIVKPISAQDFYNTPQLRERGPVLFSNDGTTTTSTTTTTTTTTMAPSTTTSGKSTDQRLKSIPKSALEENEEIYLLLKYENPRKKPEEDRKSVETQGNVRGTSEEGRQSGRVDRGGQQQSEERTTTESDFLQEGIRAGGSFTTVGFFVNDQQTTTPMTPVSSMATSGRNSQKRGSANILRNSYGDFLSGDLRDFEDSIRPVKENSENGAEENEDEETDEEEGLEDLGAPQDLDGNLDISEMTRILAGRQGGLTIAEFNKLFRDYLKKELTVDDLEQFSQLEDTKPSAAASIASDPTKSFDIRAENGKKSQKTANGLPGPTAAQKQQLEKLKVLINRPPGKGTGKLVKIGYGGSKSYQGVYKSQKFLEKVKSERGSPGPAEGPWGVLGFRQQLPMREIGPMAYVDNPVFGFAAGGGARTRGLGVGDSSKAASGGQSYVKFQKIS